MTIRLVGTDPELENLCRTILAEMPELGHSCTVVREGHGGTWQKSDIYIWDFDPNVAMPASAPANPLRHIYVVDRADLADFRERTAVGEGSVVLKPVSRATLTSFLVAAVSSGEAKSLRADRDEILQCLIQTNLKLQEYDQERTAFLARALHDFRAPLTALSGYCGLLLSEPLGQLSDSQTEVLRRMQNSAKRLSRMASAMYELSVGNHVKRQPDLQPSDLRECVQQALHEIAPFADEKSISITVDLAPGSEELWFEAGQMQQVLINLLDNACRFTPRAGAIEIRGYGYFWERRQAQTTAGYVERRRKSRYTPNTYRVDIGDSGAPIPEEHLDDIFEEYTSVAGGRDRSGGGLGLPICRMILQQHSGRIWAENRDTGPVLSFVVPLAPGNKNNPLTNRDAGIEIRPC